MEKALLQENIKKIIGVAIYAPSGDNCQPWRFEVKDNIIFIFDIPEKDTSLYNWGQRASLVAHGALVENIVIAASHFGYTTQTSLFPDQGKKDLIARVSLNTTNIKEDPFYPSIAERTTNRRPYTRQLLTIDQRNELLRQASGIGNTRIVLIEDEQRKKILAQTASVNEKILFENKNMHNFFYDHITWSEQEDKDKKRGFLVKTLEIPSRAQVPFKIFKSWRLLRLCNPIMRISDTIARENAVTYGASSILGAIIIPDNSKEAFFNAGRALQRLWLSATAQNISFQMLTGIPLMMNNIRADGMTDFSQEHIALIKSTYEKMVAIFNITANDNIAFMFRIGKSDGPSARTLRSEPLITFL